MNWNLIGLLVASLLSVVVIGCNGGDTPSGISVAKSPYVASVEPVGAVPVGDARLSVKTDEQVTLVGHIGGSPKPFVDGMAAFTIVDPKVAYCPESEGCPTPWDYCCEQNEVQKNIAMIKVVDSAGKLVAQDAKKLLGVKELSLVVVQGNAQRDEQGNLTLLATQVYLKGQAK